MTLTLFAVGSITVVRSRDATGAIRLRSRTAPAVAPALIETHTAQQLLAHSPRSCAPPRRDFIILYLFLNFCARPFLHKTCIIGISWCYCEQRFFIREKAKLIDVKPYVKRSLKVLLQDNPGTVIQGELTFQKSLCANRDVGIVG